MRTKQDHYKGIRRGDGSVEVLHGTGNGVYRVIDLAPSIRHVNHSPTGFEWGYGGSGPAQLAFAILLDYFGADLAKRHYQDFKWDHVSKFDKKEWRLDAIDLEKWTVEKQGAAR